MHLVQVCAQTEEYSSNTDSAAPNVHSPNFARLERFSSLHTHSPRRSRMVYRRLSLLKHDQQTAKIVRLLGLLKGHTASRPAAELLCCRQAAPSYKQPAFSMVHQCQWQTRQTQQQRRPQADFLCQLAHSSPCILDHNSSPLHHSRPLRLQRPAKGRGSINRSVQVFG